MKKIYFRADAGVNIGYGHFVRTLALADMLREDFKCIFFTQSPTDYQKNEINKVCEYVELPADDSKFGIFLNHLQGDEIVVLDNYFFTSDYQKEIKSIGCKLVCIDDLRDKHYYADLLINHSIGVVENDYDAEPYTKYCLGSSFSLLRSPFLDTIDRGFLNRRVQEDNLSLVIAFGGVDKYNLTRKYIEKLYNIESVAKIFAIVGDAYCSDSYVEDNKVHYCKNLTAKEVATLFCTSDFAILPSSTMAKEALCCGIKLIIGYFVDNQINSYNQYTTIGAAEGCGNFLDGEAIDKVVDIISNREISNIGKGGFTMPCGIKNNLVRVFKDLI